MIGSGPIRIGQGIEFDYCSRAAPRMALQRAGVQSIMINSNPETVSTDFDTSDRLYFEPLDARVGAPRCCGTRGRRRRGRRRCIVQFGGQTAINLAGPLTDRGVPILGSSVEAIDLAEDRERFEAFLRASASRSRPARPSRRSTTRWRAAERIGYPVLVRPSYVLGGRAMEIVHTADDLARYLRRAASTSRGKPVLIDKYSRARRSRSTRSATATTC